MQYASHRPPPATLATALLALVTPFAAAQTPAVRITGRVQAQFSTVAGDSTAQFNPHGAVTSAFDVRRLRIQADVGIGENVTMVLMPSFEMASLRMRDAWLRVRLAHGGGAALGVTMGQEKKPFSRYELTSSNTLVAIERGARFRGVSGGVAAQNNLLEENGYIAHDLGASLDGSLRDGRFGLKVGVYNGSGESAADVNNAKTLAGRATAVLLADDQNHPVLRVGAGYISRDRAVTATASSTSFVPDSSRRTSAFELDAEWGDFRPGLHVIADFATGDNLDDAAFRYNVGRNNGNLRPGTPDSAFATFRSLHVVASWRWQRRASSGNQLVAAVEPALRLDLTDPSTARKDDAGLLVTPVLNLHVTATTVLRAGLDWYRYRDAAGASKSVRALRLSWQANF